MLVGSTELADLQLTLLDRPYLEAINPSVVTLLFTDQHSAYTFNLTGSNLIIGQQYTVEVRSPNTQSPFTAPLILDGNGASFSVPTVSLVKGLTSLIRVMRTVGEAKVASNEVGVRTD